MPNTSKIAASPYKCVLLVDDDDTSLYLSELIIRRSKFAEHTHVINNGDDALVFIEERCHMDFTVNPENCPDLVFLDINMPGMDGFAVLDCIKKMKLHPSNSLKIFMLTSSESSRDVEHAKKLGVDGFINKPLNALKLSEILKVA